jgi:cellulose biosynthesis protein BcsQ
MAKIHFIGGEKGGVGKSLMARVLAQYFIDRELPFIGFDTDRSHGALMRFYSGYASPVIVDRYEALDAIMEAAVEDPDRRILVDLRDFQAMNAVYAEVFGDHRPARTTVQVASLPDPGLRVEIDCIAYTP